MSVVDMSLWQGRNDVADGALGLRWHQVIRAHDAHSAPNSVALLGFACDAGVARNHGRVGARQGPAALRRALANMPALAQHAIVDAGDVVCVDGDLEVAQQQYAQRVTALLGQQLLPIGLGGGHEIAYAAFCGLAEYLALEASPKIGIINLDAHFDLRGDAQASSGTPFRQMANDCAQRGWDFNYCCLGVSEFANTAALFERANQLKVTWRLDEDMTPRHLPEIHATLSDFMARVDVLYFTLCLDVLPAAVVPAVSAPAPRGVPLEVVEAVLDAIAASGKLKLFDVAELNPTYDMDQQSARVAARLVARLTRQCAGGAA
ncbi:MAG: formimidoylglutamase [Formosimonas sp.]